MLGLALAVAVFSGSARRVDGLLALSNGSFALAGFASGEHLAGLISSAICAWAAHSWWNNGGGGGPRRRLRALARKFTGARRAAPVYGGAS